MNYKVSSMVLQFYLPRLSRTTKVVDSDTNEKLIQETLDENPEYDLWDKKDSAVKIWIYSSLTSNYLKHLVSKNTAHEYWVMPLKF